MGNEKDFKIFGPDAKKILEVNGLSEALAKEYNHSIVNDCHIFCALQSLLGTYHKLNATGTSDEHTAHVDDVYNRLTAILNKFGITGAEFQKSFFESFPQGDEKIDDPSYTAEYKNIYGVVRSCAIERRESAIIEDVILAVLSDYAMPLFTILSNITGSDEKTREMYNEIAAEFKRAVVKKYDDLEEIRELTNINQWVKDNPQKVIGADKDIKKLLVVLRNRTINNAVLTGAAGTGKTTIIYELAQRINSGDVPDCFKNKTIYQLDPTSLVAGTMFRGSLEEKIMNILDAVKEHREDVILFIDELHAMMDAGGSTEGATSVGNMLKPYITRNDVQIIGATTNTEYRKHIAKDKAFASRFKEVKIEEPTREEMFEILQGLIPVENTFFDKDIKEELLYKVIDLADRYTIDFANPRKSIIMLESACSYAAVFKKEREVSVDEIIEATALQYNVHLSKTKTADTYKALKDRILGEDKAIAQITRNLYGVDKNIGLRDKPRISMIFAGPTGTGKTEAAKIIAKNFCGSENNLVKISMSEYAEPNSMSKITGSNPGYVGYDDEPQLFKGVREHPNCVVLFDEFEKAHINVIKTLMDALDEGYLTDNKGDKVSFKDAIIIFTTNLGCSKDSGKAQGMGFSSYKKSSNNDEVIAAIEEHFKSFPECLTRINDIIVYENLTDAVVDQIIARAAKEVMENAEVSYELTSEDYETIKKESDIVSYGARNIIDCTKRIIITRLMETGELKDILADIKEA